MKKIALMLLSTCFACLLPAQQSHKDWHEGEPIHAGFLKAGQYLEFDKSFQSFYAMGVLCCTIVGFVALSSGLSFFSKRCYSHIPFSLGGGRRSEFRFEPALELCFSHASEQAQHRLPQLRR